MKKTRMIVNALSLAVIFGGAPLALSAQASAVAPGEGGSCCSSAGATCYIRLGDWLIIQEGAKYC
jgi:hypothetical protein